MEGFVAGAEGYGQTNLQARCGLADETYSAQEDLFWLKNIELKK